MIHRLRVRLGKRGEVLLFLAALDLVYAYGLLNPPAQLTANFIWPEALAPLWICALAWALTAVACLAYAFAYRDFPAYMVAVGLKIIWGGLYLIGWLNGVVDRGYLSAVIWLGFAWLVYRIAGGIPGPQAPQTPGPDEDP